MPAGTGISQSYSNAGGLRQDLLNQMRLIQETKTPFVNRLKTSIAKNRIHQWTSDRILTPADNNATNQTWAEGADFNPSAVADYNQSTNTLQIIREDFGISGSMEAMDYAGVTSNVAHQKMKNLKAIGVGLEVALLQGTGNSGASATNRAMTGLNAFAVAGAAYTGATGTATQATFNTTTGEEAFLDNLQELSLHGVDINFAYVNNVTKRQMDKWTLNVVKYEDMQRSNGTFYGKIAVYESSFGKTELIYSAAQNSTSVVFGEINDLKIAYLRRPFSQVQGLRGDSWPVIVLLEATLEVLNPYGVGYISLV